ncbi:MAG: MlaD family protein [Planctomycetota bacterium]
MRLSWWWIVTVAALLLAITLVAASWRNQKPHIAVRFTHGRSIVPGDRLRHRGIEVGEVTSVTLADDLEGVRIAIALEPSAWALAREGSRFWIERPQVSLTNVSGLETIVGGQYVAVSPGPHDGAHQTEFAGLESPPVGELAEGGLEIELETTRLGGLRPRAPVTYRGVPVGRITSVGLATDAASVTAHAFIEPAFVKLVRGNTQFWRKGGLDLSVGLTGLEVSMESLSSLAIGGVSFATPDLLGDHAKTGQIFTLHDQPQEDWLAWNPRVPVGSELLPGDLPPPRPLRASLRWGERSFGFQRDRQRQGWVLPLEGRRLLGPSGLLTPNLPEDSQAALQVGGQEYSLTAESPTKEEEEGDATESLAVLDLGVDVARAWPVDRIRAPQEPEACLVVGATNASVLPIAASRLTIEEEAWRIDGSLPLTAADYHGASVVAVSDGHLIGIAIVNDRWPQQIAVVSEEVANRLRE